MTDDRHREKKRKRPYLRNALTDLHKIWHDQATCFVSACCYGIKNSTDVFHTSHSSFPKCILFHQRGKLSLKMWKKPILKQFYGAILVLSFHFSTQKTLDGKKITNKSLCPTALNSKPALDFILKIIKCSYKSQSLCSTKRCSNVAYLAQCFVLASVLTELW